MADWYALSALDELGPMTREELADLVRKGEIDPDTLVRQGKASWQPARDVPGLCEPKPKKPKPDEAGNSGKAEAQKPKSGMQAAIDAALEAEAAAAKRAAELASDTKPKHAATATSLGTPVTKQEVEQEARDLMAELAPSLPYWLMGLGFGFWFVTIKAAHPSLALVLNYLGLAAGLYGASLYARMRWGRELKWIRKASLAGMFLLIALWACFDSYVTEYKQDGTDHRDTIRRWTGTVLARRRYFRQPGMEYESWGPTNAAGQPHGHWQTRWIEPTEYNARDAKGMWFWNGTPMSEEEYHAKRAAS